MKKYALALLSLASALPMTGAAKNTVISPTGGALVAALITSKATPHDTAIGTHDIQEQKYSAKYLRAQQRIARLTHIRTLKEETKSQKLLIAKINDDPVWKMISIGALYKPILTLLSRYLQLGIAMPLTTTPMITKYDSQRAVVVGALTALGYPQKPIQELWEQGNTFWSTKIPDITRLNELQALTYLHEWNDDMARYNDALKMYKDKVDLLHADWIKAAQPLLILYSTLYNQRRSREKGDLQTPEQVKKPLY